MGSAEAAKNAYEAFSKGDLETLKEGFAEDAEWQTSDELPLGGVTRGRDAIMENFEDPNPPALRASMGDRRVGG